jgi:hypothetical protein
LTDVELSTADGISFPNKYQSGAVIMRSLILWLIGIPIPVIILIWLFVD